MIRILIQIYFRRYNLNLVLLNCLFLFLIHFKLEFITQLPVANDDNMFIYENRHITNWLDELGICVTNYRPIRVAVFVVDVFYVLLYPTRLAVWFFSVVDETRRKNSPSNFCWMTFDLWPFWRKNVDDENSHSNGPIVIIFSETGMLYIYHSQTRHSELMLP